ncbi:MAG: hypothetical protein WD825_09450 [Gemmatimonadaceae bacterium]
MGITDPLKLKSEGELNEDSFSVLPQRRDEPAQVGVGEDVIQLKQEQRRELRLRPTNFCQASFSEDVGKDVANGPLVLRADFVDFRDRVNVGNDELHLVERREKAVFAEIHPDRDRSDVVAVVAVDKLLQPTDVQESVRLVDEKPVHQVRLTATVLQ